MPPLVVARSVTIGAGGAGSLSLGPVPPWSTWKIDRLSVRATAGLPEARIYRGDAGEATFIDGTYNGANDVSEYNPPLTLQQGEYLTVAWTGGTMGALATARIEGTL